MTHSIGVVVIEHVAVGLVEDDHVAGKVHANTAESLLTLPAEEIVRSLGAEIMSQAASRKIDAVGLAFPGIIRGGIIEDSPNLPQLKGFDIGTALRAALAKDGLEAHLTVSNDADAIAAGIAATRGRLDRLVRVWLLGHGIGFGHYPAGDGVWEGGHTVVSLDPAETFCACGGRGHLEGIMGYRSMRLRFLDREPEEVFASAKANEDPACTAFVLLWHQALAAATATSIHLEGAGKFYIAGLNARFVNPEILNRFVQEMVKMSPLQAYSIEIVDRSDELAVLGAAVNALRA
jgi:predicted NBD/HSP70 family sugar kinase